MIFIPPDVHFPPKKYYVCENMMKIEYSAGIVTFLRVNKLIRGSQIYVINFVLVFSKVSSESPKTNPI